MKISHSWLQALTAPFVGVSAENLDMFDGRKMAHRFQLSVDNGNKLASAASFWYTCIGNLPVDAVMKQRLKTCTMRFSHWVDAKTMKQTPKGKKLQVVWRRKRRRCDRAKLCPWCRQRIVLHLYANLADDAKNGRLKVLVRDGHPPDKKRLSRAPAGSLAAVRNIVYPHGYTDPVFRAAFFFKAFAGSSAEPCDLDDLREVLGQSLTWDRELFCGSPNTLEYLRLLGSTRLWSLNS